MADGTTHTVTKADARGGGETPFTREEILGKFDSLVGSRLPTGAASELRDRLLDVESADSVETVLEPALSDRS
jgi:hypothetical protein